jgi:hypothetical protein
VGLGDRGVRPICSLGALAMDRIARRLGASVQMWGLNPRNSTGRSPFVEVMAHFLPLSWSLSCNSNRFGKKKKS